MLDDYIGQRRRVPLHTPAQTNSETEETAQNNGLQADAEATDDNLQVHAPPSPEDFTISVEQVRDHFRSKGLSKSKDTVQRWCRNGELACRKRGVLNRYFTTEASLLALEQKLLPDMMAENAGGIAIDPGRTQLDAAAVADERSDLQVHDGANASARSDLHRDTESELQVHAPERSDKRATPQDEGPANPDVSRLVAENEGLRAQLENRDSQIEFLQEEIRFAREQRSSVVQISNRMLETLETMAIGGRLERGHREGNGATNRPPSVHYETKPTPEAEV